MPIGVPELLVVLVIVLLIFGPKRLPDLGRQLGSGIRNFKDGLKGDDRSEIERPPEQAEDEAVTGEVVRDDRR